MKILIVDDEEMIREVIKEYCLEENYEVYESSSGIDALKKIENNSFDLMVLDIMMPEMDGFTLLSKIPKDKHIPTIILSARDEIYDK